MWKRKPGPKTGLESGANGRRGGDRIRMEFREEEKHLSPPHLFTASSLEELFEQSTSSGKGWRGGCDGGIFLDPSFLLLASTHGLSRACSHLLVEYARFRVPSPPLRNHAKSFSLLSTFLYFHVSIGPPCNTDIYRLSFSSFRVSLSFSSFVLLLRFFLIFHIRIPVMDLRIDG